MAKLIQPAPKFTHPEWRVSNQSKFANAEAERIAAERLIDESQRLADETRATTCNTQRDVNTKFGQYISRQHMCITYVYNMKMSINNISV